MKDRIDVWKVNIKDVRGDIQNLINILSKDEKERVARLCFDKDKKLVIISRAILRLILSLYLERPPQNIVFSYTGTMKPVLKMRNANRINFNVAHSHDLILYAFSRRNMVGIDIERVAPISNYKRIARRFFTSRECERPDLSAEEKSLKGFKKIWVIKEAYLKATGKGVSDMENVEVIFKKNKSQILRNSKKDKDLSGWKIQSFEPETNYVASIVYKRM